jgi:hypothetical protein
MKIIKDNLCYPYILHTICGKRQGPKTSMRKRRAPVPTFPSPAAATWKNTHCDGRLRWPLAIAVTYHLQCHGWGKGVDEPPCVCSPPNHLPKPVTSRPDQEHQMPTFRDVTCGPQREEKYRKQVNRRRRSMAHIISPPGLETHTRRGWYSTEMDA